MKLVTYAMDLNAIGIMNACLIVAIFKAYAKILLKKNASMDLKHCLNGIIS